MEELSMELKIESMIYEIRGKQVMLDSDLAKLYQVETKRINEAVSRNKEKFPERFSFKLTDKETRIFLVAFCDQKNEMRGGRYKNPRVFTEQGVAMLSTILKSKVATQISIQIMDAFVAMRKYISTNLLEQKYVNNMLLKHDNEIRILFEKLESKELVNEIFFEGQIYDAYSKIIDIMMKAKEKIIIIDAYADKYVLDMISKVKVQVIMILSSKSRLSQLDIDKYNREYNNLILVYDETFHDRYIILDKSIFYHLGTSLNNAGTKTFSVNKLEDMIVKNNLLINVGKIIDNSFK